jgi:hypothetical protein
MLAGLVQAVDRRGARVLDIGARGVEVRVVGNHTAGSADDREENLLRCAALMRRNHDRKSRDLLHRRLHVVEAAAARIALVTVDDARPLTRAHRRRAAVGQQIDQHVLGAEEKGIEAGFGQMTLTLVARGERERFDGFDLKRFDDRLDVRIANHDAVEGGMRDGVDPDYATFSFLDFFVFSCPSSE